MNNTVPSRLDIKNAFDKEVINVFRAEITQSIRDADGNPKDIKAIWQELGVVLGLSADQVNRYILGQKKGNTQPISPFDGRSDHNPPPLETGFRYVAAIDLSVKFPQGREVVNRALANSMRRIHSSRTGENLPLTAAEVERLRFLRQWLKKDEIGRPAISFNTVKDMRRDKFRRLMEPIRRDKEFVEELKVLPKRWNTLFTELVDITKYEWLNNKRAQE